MVLLTELDRVLIDVKRVSLNLVQDWLHVAELHKILQVSYLKVTHASSSNLLLFHRFLQGLPASMSVFYVDRIIFVRLLGAWPKEKHAV